MDARTIAWLDQQDALVAQNIRAFGWHIEYVVGDEDADETSFAYTIGLYGMGHPELLLFGVSPHTAHDVLNAFGDRVQNGELLVPGELLELPRGGRRFVAEHVPNPGDVLLTADRHYGTGLGRSVSALQLTWDDVHGWFPWESDYSLPRWLQPRPGRFRA